MKTTENNGTSFKNSFDGMKNYLADNSWTSPKGDDYKIKPLFGTLDFNWIKTQIENGNPMFLLAPVNVVPGQTSSENHAFFGVGYQLTSTGDFIRVSTGLDTSFSHFINWTAYKGNIAGAWYYRW